VRARIGIFVLAMAAMSAVAVIFVLRPQSAAIESKKQEAAGEEQRLAQLQLQLRQLQALQQSAPELRARAQSVDTAIPDDPQLAQFILQVQDAASKSAIDWLAVSPTPPSPSAQPNLLQINVSMSVNGGYFQVQDFLTRLETLGRAVKISSVTLGPGPNGLPQLASSLTMKLFVADIPAT
jgi:Tfp pilus assembly protein PilO